MFNVYFSLIFFYFATQNDADISPSTITSKSNILESLYYLLPSNYDSCQRKMLQRYDYMKTNNHKYYIMINLHNNDRVISHIAFQLTKVFQEFWGYNNVFVSIYESGSRDYSKTELNIWSDFLDSVGVNHRFETGPLSKNSASMNRIDFLTNIRNKALMPFKMSKIEYDHTIFINDIYFCSDDILELVHQRNKQQADMVSGMDFDIKEGKLGFYDNWVFRDINGVRPNKFVDNLIQHKPSQSKLLKNEPIQVFCLWNGMTVINPNVFDNIIFRRGNNRYRGIRDPGECSASEITTLCLDMIKQGFDKIVMIPDVHVAYKYPDFQRIKLGKDPFALKFPPLKIRDSDTQITYEKLSKQFLCEPYFDKWRQNGPDFREQYYEQVN